MTCSLNGIFIGVSLIWLIVIYVLALVYGISDGYFSIVFAISHGCTEKTKPFDCLAKRIFFTFAIGLFLAKHLFREIKE